MEKTQQITRALRVSIIIAIFGLFIIKVYNLWIYLSFFVAVLIIRFIEIKKGLTIREKRKVLFFIISVTILAIVYFFYISYLNSF